MEIYILLIIVLALQVVTLQKIIKMEKTPPVSSPIELPLNDYDLDDDPLYKEAKELVLKNRNTTASFVQRQLRIGFARSARLLDRMEEEGIVGPFNGAKPREIYKQNIE